MTVVVTDMVLVRSIHARDLYHFPQWFKIWRTYLALGC